MVNPFDLNTAMLAKHAQQWRSSIRHWVTQAPRPRGAEAGPAVANATRELNANRRMPHENQRRKSNSKEIQE